MSEIPTEDFEHTRHAHHAAHDGEPFIAKITVTVAALAVLAASVGSLETMESGLSISEKNQAVLLQNRASDAWGFFQARSIKKNLYEVVAGAFPEKEAEFRAKADAYDAENVPLRQKAEALEAATEKALARGEVHEIHHHVLTVAATFLHIAIAVATIALVARRRRWPWYVSLVLGGIGSALAASAWLF